MLHDLNFRPWPFRDGQFGEVLAYDVVEHLDDVVATLEEIHRVARHGAVVRITVPYFFSANAFTDPTHRHQFGWSSLSYFTDEREFAFATTARFRRRARPGSSSRPPCRTGSSTGSPTATLMPTSVAGRGCFRRGSSMSSSAC